MSVKRAQTEIDAAELREWMAYYSLEPWGQERGDLRAGIIAATMANLKRGKSSKAFTPKDFMPKYDLPPRRKQTVDDVRNILRAFTKAARGE